MASSPLGQKVEELYAKAFSLHRDNQLDAAYTIYGQILQYDPQHAHAMYSLGTIAYIRSRHREATELFRGAVNLKPDEAIFYHGLAQALFADSKPVEAREILHQALSINPEFVGAWQALVEIHSLLDDPEAAAFATSKVAELQIKAARSRNQQGILLAKANRLPEARAAFMAGIACNPRSSGLYYNLGNLLVALGEFDDAVTCLMQASKLSPKSAEACVGLSNALFAKGDIHAALVEQRKALALAPNTAPELFLVNSSPVNSRRAGSGHAQGEKGKSRDTVAPTSDTLYQRALQLHRNRKVSEAEQLYEEIIRRGPDHFQALHMMGVLACENGNAARGIELIGRSIALDSSHPPAHSDLGNMLRSIGRLEEARASFSRALKLDPTFAPALYGEGKVLLQMDRPDLALTNFDEVIAVSAPQGEFLNSRAVALRKLQRYADALASIDAAIALRADRAHFHNNRGTVLHDMQRLAEALDCYDRALMQEPDYVEAHINRGNVLVELERPEDALHNYDRASLLSPNLVDAHLGRGIALAAMKRWEEALISFDRALDTNGNSERAHFNRSVVLRELGKSEEGLESCNRALALRPDWEEAHVNRAALLHLLKRQLEALESCDKAVQLNPSNAQAQLNRGIVLQHLNRPQDALECLDRALALSPNLAPVHCWRGSVLHELGQLEEALFSYDKALALDAKYAEAHSGRGLVLANFMQLDAALLSFNRAVAIKPDLASARLHRSLALLSSGNYEGGWEDYEWRWKAEHGGLRGSERVFPQARWLGQQSVTGKTILLYAEQGLGDTIQFCRYARMVEELGAEVILEVQKPLLTLLRSLRGVTRLVGHGDVLPDFDYHCPLMSLPLAFRTTLSSIPAKIPYLESDAQKVSLWGRRLGEKRSYRVGLAWSGGFRPNRPELWAVNDRRNVPLAKLAPLKQHSIEFYSLQKGLSAESQLTQLKATCWDGPLIVDFAHLLVDFADTAALIENLDLVISVDTSIAHLAAALGKHVWLLNRFDSCWRWLTDRSDSPWYPTVRVYRQEVAGDWGSVVDRIATDLMQVTQTS